eukprot:3887134-Rhodomonas_salina.2
MELKNQRRGRIAEYADQFPGSCYTPTSAGRPVWAIQGATVALACAVENELRAPHAQVRARARNALLHAC